jgi:hypothetical protein
MHTSLLSRRKVTCSAQDMALTLFTTVHDFVVKQLGVKQHSLIRCYRLWYINFCLYSGSSKIIKDTHDDNSAETTSYGIYL